MRDNPLRPSFGGELVLSSSGGQGEQIEKKHASCVRRKDLLIVCGITTAAAAVVAGVAYYIMNASKNSYDSLPASSCASVIEAENPLTTLANVSVSNASYFFVRFMACGLFSNYTAACCAHPNQTLTPFLNCRVLSPHSIECGEEKQTTTLAPASTLPPPQTSLPTPSPTAALVRNCSYFDELLGNKLVESLLNGTNCSGTRVLNVSIPPQFNESNLGELFTALQQLVLTNLTIYGNGHNLSEGNTEALGQVIYLNKGNFREFQLHGINVYDWSAIFPQNIRATVLDFSNSNLGSDGLYYLSQFSMRRLQKLDLRNTGIDVYSLLTVLNSNLLFLFPKLRELIVSGNNISCSELPLNNELEVIC